MGGLDTEEDVNFPALQNEDLIEINDEIKEIRFQIELKREPIDISDVKEQLRANDLYNQLGALY